MFLLHLAELFVCRIVVLVPVFIFIKIIMIKYHAALWSSSPSPNDNHYRTTHHQRTKQRGREDWTWEDILDGKGSYTWEEILAGRDCLPWEQVEAAWRAEAAGKGNQRYEGTRLARKPERQPPNIFWGGGTRGVWRSQVGDLSPLPVLTMASR